MLKEKERRGRRRRENATPSSAPRNGPAAPADATRSPRGEADAGPEGAERRKERGRTARCPPQARRPLVERPPPPAAGEAIRRRPASSGRCGGGRRAAGAKATGVFGKVRRDSRALPRRAQIPKSPTGRGCPRRPTEEQRAAERNRSKMRRAAMTDEQRKKESQAGGAAEASCCSRRRAAAAAARRRSDPSSKATDRETHVEASADWRSRTGFGACLGGV